MSCINTSTPSSSSTSSFLFNPCSPCCCTGGDTTFVLFSDYGCPNIENYSFSGLYTSCGNTSNNVVYSGDVRLLNNVSLKIYENDTLLCDSLTSCSGSATCPNLDCGDYRYVASCACYQTCSGNFSVSNPDQKIHLKMLPYFSGIPWEYDHTSIWEVIDDWTVKVCVSGVGTPFPPPPFDPEFYTYLGTFNSHEMQKTFCTYCEGDFYVTVDYEPKMGSYSDGGLVHNASACGTPDYETRILQNVDVTGWNNQTNCGDSYSEVVSGHVIQGTVLIKLLPAIEMTCSGFACYNYHISFVPQSGTVDLSCLPCTGCFDGVSNLVGTDPAGSFDLIRYSTTQWSGCHMVHSLTVNSGCPNPGGLVVSGNFPIFYDLSCYNKYYTKLEATFPTCDNFYPVSGTCITGFTYLAPTMSALVANEDVECGPVDIDFNVTNTNPNNDYIPSIFDGYICSFPVTVSE